MSKRKNNTVLIIILVILAGILILTKLIREPGRQSNLKTDLMAIDTADVSRILIDRTNDKTIKFVKNGSTWTVSQGDIKSKEEKGTASGILGSLAGIRPNRLVAKSESKWNEYEVGDSASTTITFENSGGKKLGSIIIGKFSYEQPSGPSANYGRGSFSGSSYVRVPGEKEVYAVEGFLSMMLRRDFNSYRDKTFIEADKNDISRITFSYPADSSFVLTYHDSAWYAGDMKADSMITESYLNRLSSVSGNSIKDDYTPAGSPLLRMKIEGKTMQPVDVECYEGESPDNFILHSGQKPEVYFSSNKTGLFDRIFKPENYFLNVKK